MLVAVPLGLGVADLPLGVRPPRVRRVAQADHSRSSAGIPSVVLGYFAISFINPDLVVRFFPAPTRHSRCSPPGSRSGILTIPLVASVAEDALRAVPLALREASFGLGRPTVDRRLPGGLSRRRSPASWPRFILGIVASDRRDDGRGDRRGRRGRRLAHPRPARSRPDDDCGHGGAGLRQRSGRRRRLAFQSLYFVGFLLFLMTLLPERPRRPLVRRVREEY